METNEILIGTPTGCSSGWSDFLQHLPFERNPFIALICIAAFASCIAVIWIAVLNFNTMRRAEFTPFDAKTVNCRMAISRYMLIYFAAVCVLITTMSAQCVALNILEGNVTGAATMAMQRLNIQPPFILASIMVVLVGIHCVIGIIFEVRKKNLKD
jgi:hypothetical protein